MCDMDKFDLIEERPSFRELLPIAKAIEDVEGELASLADGQDTIQRACDLVTAVDNLQERVHELCLIEKDES